MQFAEPQSKRVKCIHRYYRNNVMYKIHHWPYLEGHTLIIITTNKQGDITEVCTTNVMSD